MANVEGKNKLIMSQKRAPKVLPGKDVQRALEQIYTDMNEIIIAVNQGNTSVEKQATEGKSGDVRVKKGNDGAYKLEVKADEGWLESSTATFSFKNRS